jgi:hydroxypyruvate isomerase
MNRLHQSFSWWCYTNRGLGTDDLLVQAAKIGYEGVDLAPEEVWPNIVQAGLKIAAVQGHCTLTSGLNKKENAPRIKAELLANIAKAKQWKIPQLICLTGNREGISEEAGLVESVRQLREVAPAAEAAGVTLCVELLNSKIDHPDYQCVELVKCVDSPAVRLLYDIYHMQIMEGDLIRTIERDHAWFSHYHTAGNPGRHEPDATQEIYYPPIYRAILKTGYTGWIAHEFVPTGDTVEALARAFQDAAAVSV